MSVTVIVLLIIVPVFTVVVRMTLRRWAADEAVVILSNLIKYEGLINIFERYGNIWAVAHEKGRVIHYKISRKGWPSSCTIPERWGELKRLPYRQIYDGVTCLPRVKARVGD